MSTQKDANGQGRKSLDRAISLAVGLTLCGAVILAQFKYSADIREAHQQRIQLTGQFIAQQFQGVINGNIHQLENLKQRIEVTNGEYLKYWSFDAGQIVKQNPSFRFIEWIDSNMVIQKIEPSAGNDAAIGLDISNMPYRRDQWIKSTIDSTINVTEWAKMTQGGNAFLVDDPVYFDSTFQGTITAGMVFNAQFDRLMTGRDAFYLALNDHKGQLFYSWGDTSEASLPDYRFMAEMPIESNSGMVWHLELRSSNSFGVGGMWYTEELRLVLRLIIAIMMGVTLFMFLKSSREKKRVSIINAELQRLNKDLDSEKGKAERASKAKSEFLSNMSHEIRTPLNAILGLIDIMQRQERDVESQKYFDMMTFSSKNLLGLVNDVLDFDRIESGKIELNERDFRPLDDVRSLMNLYERSFEEKGLYLNLVIESFDEGVVKGDSLKFNQVLTNLLRNSFKFTQSGGIAVHYNEEKVGENLKVKIVIKDSGIGIPKESLERIFDRFSQVETGYTRKYEGTGLGLAITKKLVDVMGGEISVKSTENEGSVFSVNFQFPLAENQSMTASQVYEQAISYEGKEVLITEDNPMNVLVLSKLLEQFGIMADVANNGKEAVDKVNNGEYDLIFMDVHMPEMDGLEATRRIRKKYKQVPIIALSANITKKSQDESKAVGMQDYITKPFTREVILRILSKYLG